MVEPVEEADMRELVEEALVTVVVAVLVVALEKAEEAKEPMEVAKEPMEVALRVERVEEDDEAEAGTKEGVEERVEAGAASKASSLLLYQRM